MLTVNRNYPYSDGPFTYQYDSGIFTINGKGTSGYRNHETLNIKIKAGTIATLTFEFLEGEIITGDTGVAVFIFANGSMHTWSTFIRGTIQKKTTKVITFSSDTTITSWGVWPYSGDNVINLNNSKFN